MLRYRSQVPLHTSLPLPSKLRQIDGLQMLRAVAVIEVAWIHAAQNLFQPEERVNFGIFGVDIFFVISGFILSSVVLRETGEAGVGTSWEFLKRRLVRIFPIYWIFAVFTGARMLWTHQGLDRSYLPAFLLLPSPTHVRTPLIMSFGWSLIFEMFFYYALGLILLKTVKWAVPVLIALLVALVVAGRCFSILHPVVIVVCNPMLLEFVFGAGVALLYARFGKRRWLGVAVTLAGVGAALWLATYTPAGTANSPHMLLADEGALERAVTWGLSAALIVGGVVFWTPALKGWLGRLMVVLGTASYSAYLASPLIIEYVSRLICKVGGVPVSATRIAVYEVLMTIGVLGLGWVCYDLIEWPVIRRLQGILLRKRV